MTPQPQLDTSTCAAYTQHCLRTAQPAHSLPLQLPTGTLAGVDAAAHHSRVIQPAPHALALAADVHLHTLAPGLQSRHAEAAQAARQHSRYHSRTCSCQPCSFTCTTAGCTAAPLPAWSAPPEPPPPPLQHCSTQLQPASAAPPAALPLPLRCTSRQGLPALWHITASCLSHQQAGHAKLPHSAQAGS